MEKTKQKNNPSYMTPRFKPAVVKSCIREVVREQLSGVGYDPEEVPELTRSLADSVRDKVKGEHKTTTLELLLEVSVFGFRGDSTGEVMHCCVASLSDLIVRIPGADAAELVLNVNNTLVACWSCLGGSNVAADQRLQPVGDKLKTCHFCGDKRSSVLK